MPSWIKDLYHILVVMRIQCYGLSKLIFFSWTASTDSLGLFCFPGLNFDFFIQVVIIGKV